MRCPMCGGKATYAGLEFLECDGPGCPNRWGYPVEMKNGSKILVGKETEDPIRGIARRPCQQCGDPTPVWSSGVLCDACALKKTTIATKCPGCGCVELELHRADCPVMLQAKLDKAQDEAMNAKSPLMTREEFFEMVREFQSGVKKAANPEGPKSPGSYCLEIDQETYEHKDAVPGETFHVGICHSCWERSFFRSRGIAEVPKCRCGAATIRIQEYKACRWDTKGTDNPGMGRTK